MLYLSRKEEAFKELSKDGILLAAQLLMAQCFIEEVDHMVYVIGPVVFQKQENAWSYG